MATYRRLFPDMPSDFGRVPRSVLSKAKRGERETRTGAWRRGANVQLVGVEELSARLRFILENTEDLRPAWKALYHPAVAQGTQWFFASQGDNRWRDLTAPYLFYKAKHGGGTRTLIGTPLRKKFPRARGTLYNSLTNPTHPLHIFAVSPRWMRTGTKDPVASIHFAKRGVRKRKAIDAKSPSMQAAMRRAIDEHLSWYEQMWSDAA